MEGEEVKEGEVGSGEVTTGSYMTMTQSENCRLVDASIQKNISFDGKPVTPTSWNGGIGEIFSLRDQLKQAEERASQVQREVRHIGRMFIFKSVDMFCVDQRLDIKYKEKVWIFFSPQCDGLKMELQELQILYDSSEREREELEEELQRCKAELQKLSGGSQVRSDQTSLSKWGKHELQNSVRHVLCFSVISTPFFFRFYILQLKFSVYFTGILCERLTRL